MSANAIETLRAFGGSYDDCGEANCDDCQPYRDRDLALQKMEVLLEAAKAIESILNTGVGRDDGWEDPDTGEWVSLPSKSARIISRHSKQARALSDAIRLVEESQ